MSDAIRTGQYSRRGNRYLRDRKSRAAVPHNVIVIMDDMKALLDRIAPTTERDRVREIHLRYEAAKEADL